MALAAPIVVLKLSTLKTQLEIRIPDSSDVFPEGTVYAILGVDEENPHWRGDKISAGSWNEEAGEFEKLQGLKVYVAKKTLAKYVGQTLMLRYQTIGESSMAMSSEPVMLRIEK